MWTDFKIFKTKHNLKSEEVATNTNANLKTKRNSMQNTKHGKLVQ